ncbi:hypothetical protein [Desulfuromonas thiophila]|uniref:FlgN protein n=1 Tax=Desulfuromonas thiophila TaxID=57664 RepID=A0A1G6X820_9BACT|nr:hypothetical protein [Desulfuromonas thiophila]SDD74291.1 hypothetical protein SAMN05661003_101170 [Desulfuromonas thiophila]
MCFEVRDELNQLAELLRRERDCACQLRMNELRRLAQEKTSLLMRLNLFPLVAPAAAERQLLRRLARENRRNGRLFAWAGQQAATCLTHYFQLPAGRCYGPGGRMAPQSWVQCLLQGRI